MDPGVLDDDSSAADDSSAGDAGLCVLEFQAFIYRKYANLFKLVQTGLRFVTCTSPNMLKHVMHTNEVLF